MTLVGRYNNIKNIRPQFRQTVSIRVLDFEKQILLQLPSLSQLYDSLFKRSEKVLLFLQLLWLEKKVYVRYRLLYDVVDILYIKI